MKLRSAEDMFKHAVTYLIGVEIYPSPRALNQLIHGHTSDNINGRECRWRREVCHELGFKLKGYNLSDINHKCNYQMCKGFKELSVQKQYHERTRVKREECTSVICVHTPMCQNAIIHNPSRAGVEATKWDDVDKTNPQELRMSAREEVKIATLAVIESAKEYKKWSHDIIEEKLMKNDDIVTNDIVIQQTPDGTLHHDNDQCCVNHGGSPCSWEEEKKNKPVLMEDICWQKQRYPVNGTHNVSKLTWRERIKQRFYNWRIY
jgi:hypothetical protein